MAATTSLCNACGLKLELFTPDANTRGQFNAIKSYSTNCQHVLCAYCRRKSTNKCICVCEKECRIVEVNIHYHKTSDTYSPPRQLSENPRLAHSNEPRKQTSFGHSLPIIGENTWRKRADAARAIRNMQPCISISLSND